MPAFVVTLVVVVVVGGLVLACADGQLSLDRDIRSRCATPHHHVCYWGLRG